MKIELVLHKCDGRCCVDPEHLFLSTAKDNTADLELSPKACTCGGVYAVPSWAMDTTTCPLCGYKERNTRYAKDKEIARLTSVNASLRGALQAIKAEATKE